MPNSVMTNKKKGRKSEKKNNDGILTRFLKLLQIVPRKSLTYKITDPEKNQSEMGKKDILHDAKHDK